MGKQIIRLTESDLHRIIKESVNRILRESNEEDLEAARAELRAAKESGDKKRILAAAQEFQRLKELTGNANIIKQPDPYFSEKENAKRGIAQKTGTDRWRVMGNMGMKKELDKMDRERLQVNPELGIG
jgi:hypothetical protein